MNRIAITHEINRVLGENTIAYSTSGKYVREFICGSKNKDSFIVRQFEWVSLSTIGPLLCLRGTVSFAWSNREESDDVEVHCIPSFDEWYGVETETS
jgi:hypothetical protein